MSLQKLPSTARFAVFYLVAIAAGQLTVLGKPDATPMIWPATAVAAVWLVNRNDSRWRWADAGVLGVLTTLALAVTGRWRGAGRTRYARTLESQWQQRQQTGATALHPR